MLGEFGLLTSLILFEDSFSQLSRQQPKNGEGADVLFFFSFSPPLFLFLSPSSHNFCTLWHVLMTALFTFGIFADGLSLPWKELDR